MELLMSSPVKDFYERLPKLQSDFEAEYNRPGKRGRPRKNKMYFTPVTEEAIIAYNNEKDEVLKNRVYKWRD